MYSRDGAIHIMRGLHHVLRVWKDNNTLVGIFGLIYHLNINIMWNILLMYYHSSMSLL